LAERLVACDKFVMDRCETDKPFRVGGDESFHLLVTVEGAVNLPDDPTEEPLARGQTALLPASLGEITLVPQEKAILLDVFLPVR
jgi:mannose-6-phosphate isomerase class I